MALTHAKLMLGRRMHDAGIDDGQLGARIAAVGGELRRAEVRDEPADHLRAERSRLFIQLADAALEFDAPLPGADAEYRRAWQAEAALRAFDDSRTAMS